VVETQQDLPEGFQTAEFLLEHGFLDFITRKVKDKINLYIDLIQNDIR
jgi:acetyl-CoA carboxylase carboxyl transferase subunit beta